MLKQARFIPPGSERDLLPKNHNTPFANQILILMFVPVLAEKITGKIGMKKCRKFD